MLHLFVGSYKKDENALILDCNRCHMCSIQNIRKDINNCNNDKYKTE